MLSATDLIDLATHDIEFQSGRPRQAVLRRAVSTAYYAVFHGLLRQISICFVPERDWKSRVLFYRALDHARARERCRRAGKSPLPPEETSFFRFTCFEEHIRLFCDMYVSLQSVRHSCDYDPEFTIAKAEAQELVVAAQEALFHLENATTDGRRLFLGYLLFGLRS